MPKKPVIKNKAYNNHMPKLNVVSWCLCMYSHIIHSQAWAWTTSQQIKDSTLTVKMASAKSVKNYLCKSNLFCRDSGKIFSFCKSSIAGLLKHCGKSLDSESLQILMAKFEAKMNSCRLNANTIIDVNFPVPLVLENILTMKSEVQYSYEQLSCMQ